MLQRLVHVTVAWQPDGPPRRDDLDTYTFSLAAEYERDGVRAATVGVKFRSQSEIDLACASAFPQTTSGCTQVLPAPDPNIYWPGCGLLSIGPLTSTRSDERARNAGSYAHLYYLDDIGPALEAGCPQAACSRSAAFLCDLCLQERGFVLLSQYRVAQPEVM